VTREKRGEEGGGDATPNKYLKRRAFGLARTCMFFVWDYLFSL
jgi:hypothetical protein